MKFTTGLIIGVLIVSLFWILCNPLEDTIVPTSIKIERDTVRDTVYRDSFQYVDRIDGKPEIIPETLIIYRDTFFLKDTVFVYDDYFNKYVYSDTLKNDSDALVFIRDTIYMNKLYNRFSDVQIFNTTITKIIPGNDVFLTLGGFYITNPSLNSFGLKTGLESAKNEINFGIGTDKTFLFEYERKFNLKPLNFRQWLKKRQ